jgi:hypothetical protein
MTAAATMMDDPYDVDDAALLEEASYGDDELGAFGALANHDEATSIGTAPGPADGTIDEAMPRSSRSGSGPKTSDW